MKKRAEFLLAIMCVFVATQRDPAEEYCDYLKSVTEEVFMSAEDIRAADATVTYDEVMGQYSIELSIETNGEVM